MQVITLTAPDGHQERWDINTTYLALKSWYSYLSNPEPVFPTNLASLIRQFVGDDVHQVHVFLIYVQSIKLGLFRELSQLTRNQDSNVARLYFIMKSLAGNYPVKIHKDGERGQILNDIQEVTGGSQKKLNQLIELLSLFVDGYLSYDKLGVN